MSEKINLSVYLVYGGEVSGHFPILSTILTENPNFWTLPIQANLQSRMKKAPQAANFFPILAQKLSKNVDTSHPVGHFQNSVHLENPLDTSQKVDTSPPRTRYHTIDIILVMSILNLI